MPSRGAVLFGVWLAVVIAAVVVGVVILGSPGAERARRLDIRRVADLQGIASAADLYWTRHSRLPVSLDELEGEPGVGISTRDPVNGDAYGYQRADSSHYELCASFDQASDEHSPVFGENLWAHAAGEQCFRLEANEIERAVRIPSR